MLHTYIFCRIILHTDTAYVVIFFILMHQPFYFTPTLCFRHDITSNLTYCLTYWLWSFLIVSSLTLWFCYWYLGEHRTSFMPYFQLLQSRVAGFFVIISYFTLFLNILYFFLFCFYVLIIAFIQQLLAKGIWSMINRPRTVFMQKKQFFSVFIPMKDTEYVEDGNFSMW